MDEEQLSTIPRIVSKDGACAPAKIDAVRHGTAMEQLTVVTEAETPLRQSEQIAY